MGPLIADEKKINIIYDGEGGYFANEGWLHHSGSIFDYEFEVNHKNPLRAAAIVWLMMKGADNERN